MRASPGARLQVPGARVGAGRPKENIAAWDRYKAEGVQVVRLSEDDVQKFRRYAIPMWPNGAGAAFASQLALMKTINVGNILDSMLVDLDATTKLSL